MKDTLYFDGNCPICRAEISKLSNYTQGNLTLIDIHTMEDNDDDTPDKNSLLSRLHLKTTEGQWLIGLEANIRAWHHTPFRHLWRILNWPVLRIFSHWFYELWLKLRSRNVRPGSNRCGE